MTLALRRKQLYAAACGMALLFLLLLVASFDGMLSATAPQQATLLSLRMYEAPPTPPQPPLTRNSGGNDAKPSLSDALNAQSSGSELGVMELNADLRLAVGVSGEFGSGFAGLAGDFGTGLGSGEGLGSYEPALADLEGLDSTPVLIFAPQVNGRKFFSETGVKEFSVRFHVVIDEQGRTTPVRLVSNPLPELEADLLRYAEQVRFTPPTRGGIPVRAEYVWPVNFREIDQGMSQVRQGTRTR